MIRVCREHCYWRIVENHRVSGGRAVQRHVPYLGEINHSRRTAWCQTIEAFDEGEQRARQVALFPADRAAAALATTGYGAAAPIPRAAEVRAALGA